MSMVMPELYSNCNVVTVKIIKSILKKFEYLIKWQKDASILEFGYADGGSSQKSFLPCIPDDFVEFVGADISRIMVEYARKTTLHPKMKFAQLDIATEHLPDEFSERFHHIFSFMVMNVVSEPKRAFHNMYNMLKPGGSVFLTFVEHSPIADALYEMSKYMDFEKFSDSDIRSPYNNYNKDVKELWRNHLNESDFENYTIRIEKENYEFPDETVFEDFFIASNPLLSKIREEKVEEYKKLYLDQLKNGKFINISNRDGRKIITMHINVVIMTASKS